MKEAIRFGSFRFIFSGFTPFPVRPVSVSPVSGSTDSTGLTGCGLTGLGVELSGELSGSVRATLDLTSVELWRDLWN